MAMRFEHEFSVPVPVEQAWSVLRNVERVAPCLPGAALDSVEGDDFTGRMKVKVGPITVTYRGEASFQEVDKDNYSLSIKAAGKESRGTGTASATVTARLHPQGDSTKVTVVTDFNVTGRPAQFGRGVMAEVGGKLIDRFAENLSALLSEGVPETAEQPLMTTAESNGSAPAVPVTVPSVDPAHNINAADEGERASVRHLPTDPRPAGTVRTSRSAEEEALDLLEIAGAPLLKRAAPVLAGLAALVALLWVFRRLFTRRG
ncbi:SRPBCC family protein [Sinosporangium siamense]|uniref:Carbon monoxide dehydrogenase subunit G n=1 Tax=Sinosporangium siamense TaxID=1367973 RepID=A0A919RBF7_9ACTN|nr:SRPBCC family protein [Sinosporangium siamense]GII90861.1 carbon monoxide dehydrogenase subunit G [Sinosporangium siamense]